MRTALLALSIFLLGYAIGSAQTRRGTIDAPIEVDPGVLAGALFENSDVRVLNVRLRPGGVRRTHQHDDIAYDVLIPTDQGVKLIVAGEAKELKPWEAVRLDAGTPHGFQNTGTTTVTLLELWMKKPM